MSLFSMLASVNQNPGIHVCTHWQLTRQRLIHLPEINMIVTETFIFIITLLPCLENLKYKILGVLTVCSC